MALPLSFLVPGYRYTIGKWTFSKIYFISSLEGQKPALDGRWEEPKRQPQQCRGSRRLLLHPLRLQGAVGGEAEGPHQHALHRTGQEVARRNSLYRTPRDPTIAARSERWQELGLTNQPHQRLSIAKLEWKTT